MTTSTSKDEVYVPRDIKRDRRTKGQVKTLDDQIVQALAECHPQSVRHVFYLMTDPRLDEPVSKTEKGYRAIKHRLKELRRSGRVPYHFINDMSRRGYHVATFGDAEDFIRRMRAVYRADLWETADVYVEVWCESRSIAGVIEPLCKELCVSLYPSGGNTSMTLAYQAAMNINDLYAGRRVVIFYVGDYDPAGVIIDVGIERELRQHLNKDVSLKFVRVAITEEQIKAYNLPTKPRKESEKRAPQVKVTVEAEAMPPAKLRQLLRGEIEALLPPRAMEVTRAAEESEREIMGQLAQVAKQWRDEEDEDE